MLMNFRQNCSNGLDWISSSAIEGSLANDEMLMLCPSNEIHKHNNTYKNVQIQLSWYNEEKG